jgi:hypothetical protein
VHWQLQRRKRGRLRAKGASAGQPFMGCLRSANAAVETSCSQD